MRICVLHVDNKNELIKKVNEIFSAHYEYEFILIPENTIYVVRDFLEKATHDIVVFLDTAWIQNGAWLDYIITQLIKSKKQGCFSREPYEARNTYINSDSFILKINNYTLSMYKTIIEKGQSHYMSEYVFNHKEHFNIFVPTILNTYIGSVLRHNSQADHDNIIKIIQYTREERVTEDLKAYPFRLTDYLDSEPFPN